MKEIWKDIKGYEGLYEVSSLGNVKSLKYGKKRILKQGIGTYGYYLVGLCINGKQKTRRTHQLVAEAFLNHIPNGFNGMVVDHINNNRQDNNINNLQLVTARENASKDRTGGTSKYIGVSLNRHGTWTSYINIDGRNISLGNFKCELLAAKAYQDKLKTINENL
jgi:hypothetical protein